LCSVKGYLSYAASVARRGTRGTDTKYSNRSSTARSLQLSVLSEMTGYARNRRFRYAPYIALFNDAGPPTIGDTVNKQAFSR